MSLFNNAASRVSIPGLPSGISSVVNQVANAAISGAASGMGASAIASTVQGIGTGAAASAVSGLLNSVLPPALASSGLLSALFSAASGGLGSQANFWGSPTPLFGGITPAEAKRIYDEMQGQKLAKKNLWMLEVFSPLLGLESRFNLFATEVEYAPFIITGDKRRIGGAVVDSVLGHEPTELRLTTVDDKAGTLKRWFSAHHAAVSHRDGTVGLPIEYAIRIKVVHAFITPGSNRGGYEDIGLFRPVNLDVNLSRREDGLQELGMTFSQLDTFMAP